MANPKAQIWDLINEKMERIWTAVPARIIRVHHADCTCDVELKVEREQFPLGIITHVPVLFPKSRGSAILLPLEKNDVVLLVCSKYELIDLLYNKEKVIKKDLRSTYYLRDAVILGGFVLNDSKGTTLVGDIKWEIPTGGIVIATDGVLRFSDSIAGTLTLSELAAGIAGVTSFGEYADANVLTGDVKLEEGENIVITRVDAHNALRVDSPKQLTYDADLEVLWAEV